ncbi:MAG: GHKL domain-containing protein [Balneolaceae bacterium]|nr:GHKL domain-containing protein [Balneolaceae bacterium]
MANKESWVTQYRMSFMIVLLSVVITQSIAYLVYHNQKEKELIQVEQEVNRLKSQLEQSLSQSVTATKMLAYLIRNDLLGDHFDEIAEELLEQNDFIDAIQYVQGTTIMRTFPLEGHEPTIGYAVLEDTTHRREAMLALERGDLYFEGPFNLIQGGRGVVGRYPIEMDNEYWGFSAVVIKYDTILSAIGTDASGSNNTYTYQISKAAENGLSTVFFEDSEIISDGIYASAFVPLGNWNIEANMNSPNYLRQGILFSVIGFVLSLILGLFLWYLATEPRRLQILVDEKTNDLEKNSRKLLRSNRELEQFAYVTSHDLQEPLRMITSFLSLLEKKYGNLLDKKGKQYIHFASDGAHRMRQIILDLLEYSRISSDDEEMKYINMNDILENTLALNRKLIKEKKAVITADPLPEVYASKSPMFQLLQNLIQNALVYHSADNRPEIHIWAEETEKHWVFYVKDNGIGIDDEYKEKIFDIFQRLHTKDEYSGTGIGLAICKKIVEQYNGSIGVESEPGNGSTFRFSIAKDTPDA